MRTLIIYRSLPQDKYRQLAEAVAAGDQVEEVHLYAQDKVDYDGLLASVLASDKTHCWW
jgi:hypothetical protein